MTINYEATKILQKVGGCHLNVCWLEKKAKSELFTIKDFFFERKRVNRFNTA